MLDAEAEELQSGSSVADTISMHKLVFAASLALLASGCGAVGDAVAESITQAESTTTTAAAAESTELQEEAPTTTTTQPVASTVAAVASDPVTISAAGDGNTAPFEVPFGGTYRIEWSTEDDCGYYIDLMDPTTGSNVSDLFSYSEIGSGENYLYAQEPGTYYIRANTGPTCPWSLTIHQETGASTVAAVASDPVTISAAGDGNTAPFEVPFGGTYRIEWSTEDDCGYYIDLMDPTTGSNVSDLFSYSEIGSGENYLYAQEPGTYYIRANTGPTCPWSLTIHQDN